MPLKLAQAFDVDEAVLAGFEPHGGPALGLHDEADDVTGGKDMGRVQHHLLAGVEGPLNDAEQVVDEEEAHWDDHPDLKSEQGKNTHGIDNARPCNTQSLDEAAIITRTLLTSTHLR